MLSAFSFMRSALFMLSGRMLRNLLDSYLGSSAFYLNIEMVIPVQGRYPDTQGANSIVRNSVEFLETLGRSALKANKLEKRQRFRQRFAFSFLI